MPLIIPKTKRQQLADRESKISAMIALSHLNSPTVFETKHGAQGSIIQVQGCPFEVVDHADINGYQHLLANFLVSLSDEFAIYVTTYRHRQKNYPLGDFPQGFSYDFNHAYQKRCEQQSFYINTHYITIMIKGATHKVGKTINWVQRLSQHTRKTEWLNFREQQHKKLHKAVLDALQLLKDFTPHLLGDAVTDQGTRSEILSFFGILTNGTEQQFCHPQQNLATFLPTRRLSFGHNTLEWQGNHQQDRQLAAIVSVKNYGGQSNATMLDALLTVDFEYISTHSFARQDQALSIENMRTQSKHLYDANDAALSQQDALIEAMDLLASNQLTFGMHHHTVLVLASTQEELEAHIASLSKRYRDADLVVVRETLNLESAFWAQIPGNFTYIRRQALISSDNFADMYPLHNYHHGYIVSCHNRLVMTYH